MIFEWTTEHSDDALHVASVLETADGEDVAVALSAETASAVKKSLIE